MDKKKVKEYIKKAIDCIITESKMNQLNLKKNSYG